MRVGTVRKCVHLLFSSQGSRNYEGGPEFFKNCLVRQPPRSEGCEWRAVVILSTHSGDAYGWFGIWDGRPYLPAHKKMGLPIRTHKTGKAHLPLKRDDTPTGRKALLFNVVNSYNDFTKKDKHII